MPLTLAETEALVETIRRHVSTHFRLATIDPGMLTFAGVVFSDYAEGRLAHVRAIGTNRVTLLSRLPAAAIAVMHRPWQPSPRTLTLAGATRVARDRVQPLYEHAVITAAADAAQQGRLPPLQLLERGPDAISTHRATLTAVRDRVAAALVAAPAAVAALTIVAARISGDAQFAGAKRAARRSRYATGAQPSGNGLVYDAAYADQLQGVIANIESWLAGNGDGGVDGGGGGGVISRRQRRQGEVLLRQLGRLLARKRRQVSARGLSAVKAVAATLSPADVSQVPLAGADWGHTRQLRAYRKLSHMLALPKYIALKAQESGAVASATSENHSSQGCSRCRLRRPRGSARTFVCECGFVTDRDVLNSPPNIANRRAQSSSRQAAAVGTTVANLVAPRAAGAAAAP